MISSARNNAVLVAASLFVAVIFVLDLLTSLRLAVWLFYLLPLLLISWVWPKRTVILFSALVTVLITVSFVLSASEPALLHAAANQALGIFIIWVSTLVLVQRRQDQAELIRQKAELSQVRAELENRVRQQVTELAEREALLTENRRQREFLEQLIVSSPIGIAVVRGAEHRFELANPVYQSITGALDRPIVGRPIAEVLPEMSETINRYLARVYETGEVVRVCDIHVSLRPGREQTYWDAECVPLRGNGQQVDGILILTNETTEQVVARRTAEEARSRAVALAEQVERERSLLEAILRQMPAGVIIAEAPTGKVVLCNEQALQLAQQPIWPGVDVDSESGFHYFHPDGVPLRPEEWPLARAVLQDEVVSAEEIGLLLPDGSRSTIHCSATPLHNAEGQAFAAVMTMADISERKQMEQALRATRDDLELRVRERTAALQTANLALMREVAVRRETEKTLAEQASLLDLSHEAIIVCDMEEQVCFWNRGAEESYGWMSGEAAGRAIEELLHTVFPLSSAQIRAELMTNGRWEGELVQRRRDGSLVTVESRWVLQRDDRGRPLAIMQIDTDITERKRSEGKLAQQGERLRVLHDIDQAILATQSVQAIAHAAVRQVGALLGLQRASLVMFNRAAGYAELLALVPEDESGPPPSARRIPIEAMPIAEELLEGRIQYVPVFSASVPLPPQISESLVKEGVKSHLSVPLVAESGLMGALHLAANRVNAFDQEAIDLASQIAVSLAVALQNASLFEQVVQDRTQLQSLSRQLLEVQESERRSISRELHDETGQALTSLMIGLGMLEREYGDAGLLSAHIAELKQTTDGIMEGLHRLAVNLRPASLDRAGLVPALRQYIDSFRRQTGLEVVLVAEDMESQRMLPEIETALYRVLQEALTNVARHARATQVGIGLERRGGSVVATVEDDGAGFDVEEARQSGRLGLMGMTERIDLLGCRLTIESSTGGGTIVMAEIPIEV